MKRRIHWWERSKARGPRSHLPAPALQIDAYSDNPILSPVDGKPIASRADLREHNKRNDVLDVGNDKSVLRESTPDVRHGEGLRADLERAYSQHDA